MAFRAVQGVAAAAMIPQVLSSLQVMYRPHERARAMGMFTGLAGLSAVLGPVIGAVLTQADVAGLGWRAIFLVNVPFGLAAVVAALRWVPESVAERRPRIDLRGVVVLALGLLGVLYPLTLGRELGWPTWVYAAMAAGIVVRRHPMCYPRREPPMRKPARLNQPRGATRWRLSRSVS